MFEKLFDKNLIIFRSYVIWILFYILPGNLFEMLMSGKEWLDERPKADLSKLPKRTKSDELDMTGTFKKLQID